MARLWDKERLEAVFDHVVQDRRWLHAHPELSFHERETSAYIEARLREMGLSPETGIGGCGIRVVLEGRGDGRTIALRADIDALPISEETGLPFASTRSGVMHACGHDAHTAMLLGAARLLADSERSWAGNIVLIFQPAEEKAPGGAIQMIGDGVLENPKVDAIFGLHINPFGTSGTLDFEAGPITAGTDGLHIDVIGRSGHGAAPHQALDPIPAAGQIVTALQHVVSRRIAPSDQAVVSIGQIHGGQADNVIANRVTMSGTLRSIDPQLRSRLHELVPRVAQAAGAAYDCEVEVTITKGYPPVVNDPEQTELARRSALRFLPEARVGSIEPRLVGEDFAHYLTHVPGSMARLGVAPPGDDALYPVHNGRLKVEEKAMLTGVGYWMSLIDEWQST